MNETAPALVNRLIDELGAAWAQRVADIPRPLTRAERERALGELFDGLAAGDDDTPSNT